MEKEVEAVQLTKPGSVVKDRFPRIVYIIILTELCERFSYSGMRAFLTLYLRSKLGYTDEGATETYHIFSTFVYIFPIFGGILADSHLGKFKTILYMMFVYACGNILVAITAIPQLAMPGRLCTLIGLFLITIGTGGIKPCVTSFGGDQFSLPEQEHHLAVYFSMLYFILCTGALVAKTISPILRSEVHCFGDKDCYSLAFGAPGLIVLASIVIFVSAKSRYKIQKPEGNVLFDFIKCVSVSTCASRKLGLKNLLLKRNCNESSAHWLDSTQHQYDQRFIKDIKKTLSILMLFAFIPVFFALLDQMGSRWTLQATKMDGRLGFLTIKPDQMQVVAPIFILIIIPVSQKYVYPFLERYSILKNPLHKLTLGGVLAGVAFIASAVVEIYLKTTYPQLPTSGYTQLRIFNGNPCPVSVYGYENVSYAIPSLSHFTKTDIKASDFVKLTLYMEGSCVQAREEMFLLEENIAVSYYFLGNHTYRFKDNLEKSKSGLPVVRFLVTNDLDTENLTLFNKRRKDVEATIRAGVSHQMEVFSSTYAIMVDDDVIISDIELENGGVYTVMIDKEGGKYKSRVIILTAANSISMAWLLPQFLVMSIAEVLFCVTGYEFTFKESPESMKAVMTAVWLLTEAAGNVIIIVITRVFAAYKQETQSLIYTGLMYVSIVIFHYLARSYQFGHDDEPRRRECRSNSEALYLQVKQAEDCLDH